MPHTIAVLIPCYNEEHSITSVVSDFRRILPDAEVYVYDNNSSDRTSVMAKEAGAIVRNEPRQGKGNVVSRMFADIDADVYVLVDGDDTYDAQAAPELIDRLCSQQLDMVVGTRKTDEQAAYRSGHRFGNAFLTNTVAHIFGREFSDILSGYRIFSRRYVKSFPALSSGFEIETELTVHALQLRMPIGEVMTEYSSRPTGSVSKLNTYRDGFRILGMVLRLFVAERPLLFFSILFGFLGLSSVILSYPVFLTYLETGLVPRFPTAILSTGLMLLAFLSLTCGVILDTVTLGRREQKRLAYLSYAPVKVE